MTQPSLLEMLDAKSLAAHLAAYFHRHPGEWIDGRVLEFAGRYAWRSRVADCRKAPFNMTIENRQRRMTDSDGRKFTISEYRYVP